MAQQLSKADKIRKILHLSNAEIAKCVGCRREYVRAVRQRTSSNGNAIINAAQRNWLSANRAMRNEWRRRYYAANRAHICAYKRAWKAKRRAEARASS